MLILHQLVFAIKHSWWYLERERGQPGELGAAYGADKFYLGQQEQIVWFDINIARVDTIRTNIAQRGFHTEEKLNYVLQVNAGDSLWFLADNDSSSSEVTPGGKDV